MMIYKWGKIMDKTFGPKFKPILKMEAIAALLIAVHLVAYHFIITQGIYLNNYAWELLPDYMSSVIRWGFAETAGTIGMMFLVHEMKEDGKLKSSDAEIYLLIGLVNLVAFIITLTRAPKLFAFLNIALSHAVVKTIIVIVTYIVPVVLMFAVVVLVAMWFAGERLK